MRYLNRRLLWLSPALPGRAENLTEDRIHRICERPGHPGAVLAGRPYLGVGPWVTTLVRACLFDGLVS